MLIPSSISTVTPRTLSSRHDNLSWLERVGSYRMRFPRQSGELYLEIVTTIRLHGNVYWKTVTYLSMQMRLGTLSTSAFAPSVIAMNKSSTATSFELPQPQRPPALHRLDGLYVL